MHKTSKKVLIISNFHEDLSISRSNMAFNYFTERGYITKVLYSSFSHSLKKQRELLNKNFISLKTISYSSSLSIKRILSYFLFSYKVFKFLGKNKFDIVYINLPPNLIGLSVLLRKKNYTKLIVDIIDLWPESFPKRNKIIEFIFYFLGILPKMIRKKSIICSTFCIAESNFFFEKLKLDNKDNQKVIHIKKFQEYSPNFNFLTKHLSILYLGNIGAIYDFKGLIKVIKGVKKNRQVELHIIGLGPLKNWLFKNLSLNGIKYNYYGATFDESMKREIISKCWFGFNGYKDSTEVALSYKSIDYLSNGVPLLNSAKADTNLLVYEEKIGFNYNSNNPEMLINKLSSISNEELLVMKRKSYQIFKNKFSGKSYYEDMDSVMNCVNRKENL